VPRRTTEKGKTGGDVGKEKTLTQRFSHFADVKSKQKITVWEKGEINVQALGTGVTEW